MPQITYNNITIGKRQIGPSLQEGEFGVTSLLAGFKRPAVPINRFPPTLVQPPVLSGNNIIPNELTIFPGIYSGSPQPLMTYQWLRDGIPFANEGLTYTTVPSDDTTTISVEVTATSPLGVLVTESNGITAALFEETTINDYSAYAITGQGKYGFIGVYDIDAFWVTGMAQEFAQINSSFITYAIHGMGQNDEFQIPSFEVYTITTGV